MKRSTTLLAIVVATAVVVSGCTQSVGPQAKSSTTSTHQQTPSLQPFPSINPETVVYQGQVIGRGSVVSVKSHAVRAGRMTLEVQCAASSGSYLVKLMAGGSEYMGGSGGCDSNGGGVRQLQFVAKDLPSGYEIDVEAPKGAEVGILLIT